MNISRKKYSLPAPFHIRGRRPSTDCMRMPSIGEWAQYILINVNKMNGSQKCWWNLEKNGLFIFSLCNKWRNFQFFLIAAPIFMTSIFLLRSLLMISFFFLSFFDMRAIRASFAPPDNTSSPFWVYRSFTSAYRTLLKGCRRCIWRTCECLVVCVWLQ